MDDYKESLDKFIWDIYIENLPKNLKPTLKQRLLKLWNKFINLYK